MKDRLYHNIRNTFLVALTLISFSSFAQRGGNWRGEREKLEALKVAFITQELALSPEEAQQFWPVYNAMEEELKTLRKEKWGNRIKAGAGLNFDTMTDEELEERLDKEFESIEQETAIKRKYFEQLKGVIPMRKVVLLYRAEERFKVKLLHELKKRRDNR